MKMYQKVMGLMMAIAMMGMGLVGCGDAATPSQALEDLMKSENQQLQSTMAQLTTAVTNDSIAPTEHPETEVIETSTTTRRFVYEYPYPDFVYEEDVLYWVTAETWSLLYVMYGDHVDLYDGGDKPCWTWELGDTYERGMLYPFKEADSAYCAVLDDKVLALPTDGEATIFIDGVLEYEYFDGAIDIYYSKDDELRQYEQVRDKVADDVIANGVTGGTVFEDWFDLAFIYSTADGTFYYAPYAMEVLEDGTRAEYSNCRRLREGDISVIKRLGDEPVDFYVAWLSDYIETECDDNSKRPSEALLAEFLH